MVSNLVIVDYISVDARPQLRQGQREPSTEVSEISRNLKLIAREFNVPLIALSQLSRSVESRPDKPACTV